MAADNVGNIIAQEALADLDAAKAKLTELINAVASLADAAQTVNFKIENIDSLIAFVDAMKQSANVSGQAATNMNNLAQGLNNVTISQNSYNQAQSAAQNTVTSTADAIQLLQDRITALNALLAQSTKGSAGFAALTSQLLSAQQKLSALQPPLQQTISNVQKLTPVLNTAGAATSGFALKIGNTVISMQSLSTQIGRSILRFAAFAVVIGGVTKVLGAVYDSIMENIKGTDEYIKKQQELIQSSENIVKSFTDLGDAYSKLIAMQDELNTSIDNSTEGLKRKADMIKAIGVLNGHIYDAERTQLDADNAVRAKELETLQKKHDIYAKLQDIVKNTSTVSNAATGQLDQSILVKAVSGSGIPTELKDKFNTDLLAGTKDLNSDDRQIAIYKNLQSILLHYDTTLRETEQAIENNKNATAVGEQTLTTKQRTLAYDKGIELEKDLSTIHEQLREANEKEDIASIDKIVNDTKAKYDLLAQDINRKKKEYATHFPDEYTDANIENYNRILGLLHSIGAQEQKNNAYEFQNAAYGNKVSTGAALSQGEADITKNGSGIPNYNQAVAALDAQTRAKKDALQAQFQQEAAQITDSSQVVEAQKIQDAKLIQIDKDAYKERLNLANEHFTQVAQRITESTALLNTEQGTRHLNALNSILTGKESDNSKDKKTFFEGIADQKATANIGLQDVANKLPAAQAAFGQADLATKGPLSPEAQAQAEKAKQDAATNLNDLLNLQAKYNNDIYNADKLVHDRKKQQLTDIKDLSIQLAQETAQAITTIQDNQFAKEQQQLQILAQKQQIANQQKIEQINASTNYQGVKDTELAKQAAQSAAAQNAIQQQENQLAIKKAKFDKEAAEAGIIMNTALAITKILASDAYDPPEAAALIAITTAIGAAQYAAAASAPIPQFFLGGVTETPIFSAAEKGRELGITPQGQAIMFDKPGTYTAPIGTTIKNAEDTQKIINYAIHGMNYAAPTIAGYDNNESIAIKVAEIISKEFREVGGDLAWVIAKNRTVVPEQESVRDVIREMDNSQAFRRNARK